VPSGPDERWTYAMLAGFGTRSPLRRRNGLRDATIHVAIIASEKSLKEY